MLRKTSFYKYLSTVFNHNYIIGKLVFFRGMHIFSISNSFRTESDKPVIKIGLYLFL